MTAEQAGLLASIRDDLNDDLSGLDHVEIAPRLFGADTRQTGIDVRHRVYI